MESRGWNETLRLIGVVALLSIVLFSSQLWAEPPAGTTVVTGEKVGAMYGLYVPEPWNGDLVLYAHGFMARQYPLALPEPEIRDALLGEGFAVALSSYSKNGWAVKEGFRQTRGLIPLFRREFGQPDHIYVTGHSMGGLITIRLIEKLPWIFDGALPLCGAIGGASYGVDTVQHVRALFDYYYPVVLPGGLLYVPGLEDPLDMYLMGLDAMLADTRLVPGWLEIGMIEGLELPPFDGVDPFPLWDGILVRMWFHGAQDLLERTRGKSFWCNMDTEYSGSADDLTLNTLIERIASHPRGIVYGKLWYDPSGRLRVPTLTLHNPIDPLVPINHVYNYAEKVAQQGKSHNLAHRVSPNPYGHCTFTVEEELAAFLDLVNWVETGVEPAVP